MLENDLKKAKPCIKRKKYGQYFTPPTIAALACAASIRDTKASVIDPMCGNGSMLQAAYERLAYLGNIDDSIIVGIEIDKDIIQKVQSNKGVGQSKNLNLICADAFLELTGFLPSNIKDGDTKFDAIIGNPPYVRYQNIAPLMQETCPAIIQAFREEMPNEPDSLVATTIIRASLITNLLHTRKENIDSEIKDAVALLRSRSQSGKLCRKDELWHKLVSSYSGLSDLSLPAWFLTWRISHPESMISFVTSASWKNRDYARILRYFMLRFLQPIAIIEQQGKGWFGDALIPTSLMIFRVRSAEEVAIPLHERTDDSHWVKIVSINRKYDLADPAVLKNIASSINPDILIGTSDGLAPYADVVIKEILDCSSDSMSPFWTIDAVPEHMLAVELLNEDLAARRSIMSRTVIQELEGISEGGIDQDQGHSNPSPLQKIPRSILHVLNIKTIPADIFYRLQDLGVDVNQGLRTGCNPLFYVKRLQNTELTKILQDENYNETVSILDDPPRNPEMYRVIMDRLSKVGAIVPVEAPANCPSSVVVRLSSEFGNRLAVLPKACLKPVLRHQNILTHISLTNIDQLTDYALVIGTMATPDDYKALKKIYPKHWMDVWIKRDRLAVMPSSLSEYIKLGSETYIERNGKTVLIPMLSAVAPNSRRPSDSTSQLFIDDTFAPRVPAWWYTLPIQPRHYGNIVIPRVNSKTVLSYLNLCNEQVLIDANFSTLSMRNCSIPVEALYAMLNSVWVNAILEIIATPMGGGSLKVEASHLRVLPIPKLDEPTLLKLRFLGIELIKTSKNNRSETLDKIDEAVTTWIADRLEIEQDMLICRLQELITEMRMSRTRTR